MNLSRDKIRSLVQCPKCGASKGEPCVGKSKKNHHERMHAAQTIGQRPAKKPKPKTDGVFYQSWDWKAVRYEALKIYGHRCQCCGWRPGDTEHGHLVVDHIKPRRHFPELALSLENLQVLCNDCNMGKGSTYSDDYRAFEERHRLTIQ